MQYDLEDIFNRGFHTKNGTVRTPQSIQSYATLATIVFQTNQNEQHGGQAIPAFDHFMAPGVLKSFRKHLETALDFILRLHGDSDRPSLREAIAGTVTSIEDSEGATDGVGRPVAGVGGRALGRRAAHRLGPKLRNYPQGYPSGHGGAGAQPQYDALAGRESGGIQFDKLRY